MICIKCNSIFSATVLLLTTISTVHPSPPPPPPPENRTSKTKSIQDTFPFSSDICYDAFCRLQHGTHSRCFENAKCICDLGYLSSSEQGFCQQKFCSSDRHCSTLFPNTVCSVTGSQLCICAPGTYLEVASQRCRPLPPPRICLSNDDCWYRGLNSFCDLKLGQCACRLGWTVSGVNGSCQPFACSTTGGNFEANCWRRWPNTECLYDSCQCTFGFKLDVERQVCIVQEDDRPPDFGLILVFTGMGFLGLLTGLAWWAICAKTNRSERGCCGCSASGTSVEPEVRRTSTAAVAVSPSSVPFNWYSTAQSFGAAHEQLGTVEDSPPPTYEEVVATSGASAAATAAVYPNPVFSGEKNEDCNQKKYEEMGVEKPGDKC